jgi:hypothetical protein
VAKAWWRDCDYELFARPTRERDAAEAEVAALKASEQSTREASMRWQAKAEQAEATAARLREAIVGALAVIEEFAESMPSRDRRAVENCLRAALAAQKADRG